MALRRHKSSGRFFAGAGLTRSYLAAAGLICLGGLVIMAILTPLLVWADSSTPVAATPAAQTLMVNSTYNVSGSYGTTGMADITLKLNPTTTPQFISDPLKAKRGIVLLVYCKGATADQAMVTNFNALKAKYAGDSSFFSFEAHSVNELGDVLTQLKAYNPPMLAIIDGNGKVQQIYTGWIDEQTMAQRIVDAVNATN